MKIQQFHYIQDKGWMGDVALINPSIILAFGSQTACSESIVKPWLAEHFPGVPFVGSSTAGEIIGNQVFDDSIVITAIELERSSICLHYQSFTHGDNSFDLGASLAQRFDRQGLKLLFVLSEGLNINGTQLVKGLQSILGDDIPITGGLAGDGSYFDKTVVCVDSDDGPNMIAAVGFYGEELQVGFGSLGGWDPFGPERLVTRAKDNVLYELDDGSALALYKRYLGEYAANLPASGLLFPLSLSLPDGRRIVRTLLAVNEDEQSMTFAGDIPEGVYARLMKANFDRLIDGAHDAAKQSPHASVRDSAELAILISCVGRKMVLEQRVEEEIEGVREVLGPEPVFCGFYSYGEICPLSESTACELHNQTMTITTLSERPIINPPVTSEGHPG